MVKFFRKSPLKNEKLQTHINATFNHELELELDVKTRWNSMVQMLRRVVKVKDQLLKAAIDFKIKLELSDEYAQSTALCMR